MESNTVRHIHLHWRPIHDHSAIFHVHMEESHAIGLMVERYQKLIIREQTGILWILPADRKAENLGK